MDKKLLQDIGLTEGESRVYVALLKLGTTKTGELAKQAQVSSSKVYKILDRLENKGIVGHVLKGQVKYFSPQSPRTIINYIDEKAKNLDEKKQEVNKMIPQFESIIKESENRSQAAIYEGFKGVTNLFRNLIDELHKGESYYVLGATYGDVPGLKDFFYKHHMRRIEKGIKLVMLANHDVKGSLVKTTGKISEIKYLPSYLTTPMEIVIYRKKAFIVLWTKEPVAFLVQNEEAMKSFKTYFDAFWKLAKK